jgi:hypothetical protein
MTVGQEGGVVHCESAGMTENVIAALNTLFADASLDKKVTVCAMSKQITTVDPMHKLASYKFYLEGGGDQVAVSTGLARLKSKGLTIRKRADSRRWQEAKRATATAELAEAGRVERQWWWTEVYLDAAGNRATRTRECDTDSVWPVTFTDTVRVWSNEVDDSDRGSDQYDVLKEQNPEDWEWLPDMPKFQRKLTEEERQLRGKAKRDLLKAQLSQVSKEAGQAACAQAMEQLAKKQRIYA